MQINSEKMHRHRHMLAADTKTCNKDMLREMHAHMHTVAIDTHTHTYAAVHTHTLNYQLLSYCPVFNAYRNIL